MNFDVAMKYGMVIPTCAKFEKVLQSKSFMEMFEDEKSYTQARLKSLNVNLAVKPSVFKMECRAGYNKKSHSTSSSSTSEYSFLFEQRLYKLKIDSYKEYLNQGITFTEDFKSDVAKLPSKYDKNDDICVNKFETFFDRFGHFVVSSAYVGGSVEVKCSRKAVGSTKTSVAEAKACFTATLEGLEIDEANLSAGAFDGQKTNTLLKQSTLSWNGGDVALQTNETICDKQKLQKWKESLLQNPTMLTSKLTLDPISTAAGCIDAQKERATYEALKDFLRFSEVVATDKLRCVQM